MGQIPVGAAEYYDAFPSSDRQPGDIWWPLPTHGVLVAARTPALVITPACDLANRKVETITYLPILSIGDYVCSRAFLPDILRAVEGQCATSGALLTLRSPHSPLPPAIADIEAAIDLLAAHVNGGTLGTKESSAAKRALDGLCVTKGVLAGTRLADGVKRVRSLFGDKEFDALAKRLVTNAYRPDIHFLPADGQPADWSAIRLHSIALFRYPLTLPIDILDLATSTVAEAWGIATNGLAQMHPCSVALSEHRPMKMLRVRPRFMSDLLTRFTALYGRLGSPDFTSAAVDRFTKEIFEGV